MGSVLYRYGEFIASRPYVMLLLALAATGAALWAQGFVGVEPFSQRELLPEHFESIKAINFIRDEFGTAGETITAVLESSPETPESNEPRDMREPEALAYIDILHQKLERLESVQSVGSLAEVLREHNGGGLPKSLNSVQEIMRSSADPRFERFISRDFSMSVVIVEVPEISEEEKDALAANVKNIIAETPKPAGLEVGLTGAPLISDELDSRIGPTIASTSSFSFIGIMLTVILLFTSIRYGLTSLLGIAFGSIWAIGLIGILSLSLSSSTSGALSMIMGIGIDFGIQVANRYRQELRRLNYPHLKVREIVNEAMAITMENVITPMSITTLSVLIGFRAMSLGQLTLLADLGNIMSLGVLTTMLAAITVVPSVLILVTKKGGKTK